MSVKKFVITFDGGIDEDQLSDVIYQGLQFYEDINWTQYNVKEEEEK